MFPFVLDYLSRLVGIHFWYLMILDVYSRQFSSWFVKIKCEGLQKTEFFKRSLCQKLSFLVKISEFLRKKLIFFSIFEGEVTSFRLRPFFVETFWEFLEIFDLRYHLESAADEKSYLTIVFFWVYAKTLYTSLIVASKLFIWVINHICTIYSLWS